MVQTNTIKKVVVLTGPTAIGKTEISLQVCKYFNGEIINADASQFKRDLNIGTAKINLNSVSIKHHLIDIIDSSMLYSISDYQKEGRKIIEDCFSRNATPFVVGGSGLYINSLLYNYNFDAPKRDQSLYNELTNEELFNLLKSLDEKATLNIPIANRKRLLRAIEVAKNGTKISENICDDKPIYDTIFICLDCPRDALYDRINKRVDIMINEGWISECIELRDNGIDLNKIGDIGYKELNSYLNKEISIDEAIDLIKKRTRHYAKRQMTWFRNKMNCEFVQIDYNNKDKTIDDIIEIIKKPLIKND